MAIDRKDSSKANVTKDYDVYLNPYALSLLYGVSSDMKDFNPDLYNNPIDRLNAMISTMLGEEEKEEKESLSEKDQKEQKQVKEERELSKKQIKTFWKELQNQPLEDLPDEEESRELMEVFMKKLEQSWNNS